MPAEATGAACNATTVEGAAIACDETLEVDGARGCCEIVGAVFRFAECD